MSYAQKLTQKDSSGKQIFGYYADSGWEAGWLPYLYARGGKALNAQATKAEVNSPEGIPLHWGIRKGLHRGGHR